MTVLVLSGAVFFLLPEGGDGGTLAPPEAPGKEPTYTSIPCDPKLVTAAGALQEKRSAACGYARVLETEKRARRIDLFVARLSPLYGASEAPVLFLAGGPGDAFSSHLDRRLGFLASLARGRDILIVDQRGTGRSRPSLECRRTPQKQWQLEECHAGWASDVDLSSFNTRQSARDLGRALSALKVPRVLVYGVSYGTRLALTFSEMHPDRVQALLIDSPIPRTQNVLAQAAGAAQEGFEKLAKACSEDASCKNTYDLSFDKLVRVVSQMNQREAESGSDWLYALSKLSLEQAVLPLVPLLVESAARGDFALMDELGRGFSSYQSSFGLHLSIQCGEFFAHTHEEEIERVEQQADEPFRSVFSTRSYAQECAFWKVRPQAKALSEAAVNVPTLVVSGAFDPVTPPRYGEAVAKALPHARHVVVESGSHGALLSDCGASIASSFIVGGLEALDEAATRCASRSVDFARAQPTAAKRALIIDYVRYRL